MKFNKLIIAAILLIIALSINVFQFQKLKEYQKICNHQFDIGIQTICDGIDTIEKGDEFQGLAVLASGTSQVDSVYSLTSYYKKNSMLVRTFKMLNNNITNKTNIREVLKTKDLTILIPALKKVLNNPLDEDLAKELYYLVREHTVIGSVLK